MSPHLSAKLLKPASPRLHPDSDESDDDMVYSPYYRAPHHARSASTTKRRPSHQLSAEVRAEIVARVLDPAYSGRREYSSRVFVDNNGDEHDPDYQLFPTQPIYPARHRRSQTTSGFFRRVPSDDDLSQDDGAESEAEWARVRTTSPLLSSGSSSGTPSPPANPMSLFDDDEWDEKEWTREVVVPPTTPKRCKHAKVVEAPRTVYVPASPTPTPTPMEDDDFESIARQSSVQLVRQDSMDTTDDTPSCGYVLRRQWATFTLHTRLSAHRIARRARRAVSVGT